MNPSRLMTLDDARVALLRMQDDPTMITESRYSPAAMSYADARMPFVEIHMAYLRKNKLVNPAQYISNLSIMIKRR
jgi:hypothetical protein